MRRHRQTQMQNAEMKMKKIPTIKNKTRHIPRLIKMTIKFNHTHTQE